jgi:uncharacterized membrane protein
MKRLGGLDLARGLACLGMIEAHAYDAYVDAPHRATVAFALTRFIALLPLPLFLTLAGMGVALRVQRGIERGEAPRDVRRELLWRGFRVVLAGYALNVIYGLMDGARALGSYLRFDVLHVIGASSMLLGLLLPGRARPQRAALVVALLGASAQPVAERRRSGPREPAALRAGAVRGHSHPSRSCRSSRSPPGARWARRSPPCACAGPGEWRSWRWASR